MGCINTKKESEIHPNIYRVINVDSDGVPLWRGTLEISPRELTLYRKGKEPTKWALQHLRRYGFDADLFTFEAGRRCTTGEGIYAFRCRRAESLFHLLQSYIQGIATHDDNTSTGIHLHEFSSGNQQNSNNSQHILQNNTTRSGSGGGGIFASGVTVAHQLQNTNNVIPANRNSLWNNGQTSGFTLSTDTLTGDYLDPTPIRHTLDYRNSAGMRLSSIGSGGSIDVGAASSSGEPNSPGSPNSFNVILEVTQLNEHHHQAYQNSNLYQEFPLRSYEHNNNFLSKKLSLDIPPQEPAPAITNTQSNISSNTCTVNSCKMIESPQMISPISDQDGDRPYVNVTPGEMDSLIGTPTTTQVNFSMPRLSSSTYSFEPFTRCYENLEIGGSIPPPIIVPPQISRLKRFSKPEIFTKIDFPPMNSSSIDNSEPSTPTLASSTVAGGQNGTIDGRKVNYIILDLDQTALNTNCIEPNTTIISTVLTSTITTSNCVDSSAIEVVVTSSSIVSVQNSNVNINTNSLLNKLISPTTISSPLIQNTNSGVTSTVNLQGTTNLLPPESPKKASLGYATIDFNKTAALSNSTAPTLDDSEGSRKTRHSLSVRQNNSISE